MDEYPKVFISYSHDNQKHANKVLEFSNRLRSEGIDCVLDQYEPCPPEGWPRWMDKQIRDSDFVLMICTRTYYRKVMGEEKPGTGLGVKWEGNLIYQHIYNAGTTNQKFIPVLFSYSNFSDIPTPVQGATYYNVDTPEGYDDLYWRLRGEPKVRKPDLGKLRPLPKKERKTDVGMFITGFIDLELWNAAKWKGIAFLHDKDLTEPPWLGLLFSEENPAIKIFQGWHKRLGQIDEFNELRISIIEGDIEGEDPGYTIHIGANLLNVLKRVDCEGLNIPKDYFLLLSRYHRMNPPPDSKNLEIFKQHYKMFGSYFLIPAVLTQNGVKPYNDLRMLKRQIELRHVSEITSKNDPDAVILPQYRDETPSITS